MRRRAGVGAIQRQKIQQDKFKEKGLEIQENQFEQMTELMQKFKQNLEEFAAKHKHEIKKNGTFRKQFQEMCAAIGVDPLASSKGFWSEMLGVGDFYYEVGVQLVELGVATSHINGGVISMNEALTRLNRYRRQENRLTEDDIQRSIKKMSVLGSGLELAGSGKNKFIYTIPGDVSMDHTILLQQAAETGCLRIDEVISKLSWSRERIVRGVNHLLLIGVAWSDDQDSPTSYWFPSLFQLTLK